MNGELLTQVHTELLSELVDSLASEHTQAIILGGSGAHGAATQYSDLDVAHIVDPSYTGPEKKFSYRGTLLVSVNTHTIDWWKQALERPEQAIFVVPSARSARVLFDPYGIFARYQSDLTSFTWESLQPKANRYAGATLAAQAETVHKILSALVRGEGLYEPTVTLTLDLTLAMAVWHGVLMESSASYMRQVRAAVGDTSPWSHWHRLATGQDYGDAPMPTLRMQAQAAIRVYRETFRLIEPVMVSDRRELARATATVVDKALDENP